MSCLNGEVTFLNIPYENRVTDFYYRDDGNGAHPLSCAAHLHRHVEFFYLLDGHCRAFIDATEYTVEPGDILIAFPNQVHRFEATGKERYLLFIVHPEMMPEWEEVFAKQLPTSAQVPHADRDPSLLRLLQLMAEKGSEAGTYRDVALRGLLLAFFGQLLPHMELTDSRSQDSHAIREIVDFCTRNYTAELSLETLEEALHLSRYYISHLFSHKMNIRFNDYVNSLRVTEACRLLRQTDRSITDISTQAGFCTLRTFNRSFVKQMGQSPSEYRRGCALPSPAEPGA